MAASKVEVQAANPVDYIGQYKGLVVGSGATIEKGDLVVNALAGTYTGTCIAYASGVSGVALGQWDGRDQSTVSGGNSDNSVVGDGSKTIASRVGCLKFLNGTSTQKLNRTDIGKTVFAVDAKTVGKTGSAPAMAVGKLVDLEGANDVAVWVSVIL